MSRLKKIITQFFILFFVFIFSSSLFALSTTTAQNLSRQYLLDNEFIDVSVKSVFCEKANYYLVSIIDIKNNVVFYVPIEVESGNVYYPKNKDSQIKSLYKTAYLASEINKSSSTNYLTTQLIDKVDALKLVLESRQAKLEGIIVSEYPLTIITNVKNTKNKLSVLINQLNKIHENLKKAQDHQNVFLNTPDCLRAEPLIIIYKDSFEGYQNLTKQALEYRDSINTIISSVVSDKELDETDKRVILNYVEAPSNLSSEISLISQSISSTKSFYDPIVTEFSKAGANSKFDLMLNNFKAREDYIVAKSLLYDFDSDLKTTLDQSIQNILNPEFVNFYKDSDGVRSLTTNYEELNDLYQKGDYVRAIPKIKLAKTQVQRITKEGFNFQEENSFILNYYFFIVGGVLILLLILFMYKDKIFAPRKRKKKPKLPPRPKIKNAQDILERHDPFK